MFILCPFYSLCLLLQNSVTKSSLVVSWLGFGIFTAMAWAHSLVRKLRSCKPSGVRKKKHKTQWLVGRRKKGKEVCMLKNWCFLPVGLEKTLDSPLDSNEIKLVNPKGNQPWIFTGRTDVETEAPIPDSKSWLIGKDSDAEKDWRQKEKGAAEDGMVRL